VDREGRIYRQVYGDTFSIWLLIDPLKELIEGTPVPVRSLSDFIERVRILCTVYDPRTNTYRFKTTIIAEIISFVAIAIVLAWFVWHERRRRRKASPR
jgi:protein SCO1/2